MIAFSRRACAPAVLGVAVSALTLTGCSGGPAAGGPGLTRSANATGPGRSAAGSAGTTGTVSGMLPAPAPLAGFGGAPAAPWRPAGRLVRGQHAVYVTTLAPPGGGQSAGVAWLDTRLLRARLYSGSLSPGGTGYRYTAPVEPAQASTLVAAFNGGFQMKDARGGYYTEHRTVVPLRAGAASLVIYQNGSLAIGAWGTDVAMTADVASVRQNLTLLVDHGRPTARAGTRDWLAAWGNTCGASSCAHTVRGVEHQWRSGLGITADGALVYVQGPGLSPAQLAALLVVAGAVRAMELDINPNWPVFVSYAPPPGHRAAPGNGSRLLPATRQGPATFFEARWARDFITLSAR